MPTQALTPRIILVMPDREVRGVMKKLFHDEGVEVVGFDNAVQAEAFRQRELRDPGRFTYYCVSYDYKLGGKVQAGFSWIAYLTTQNVSAILLVKGRRRAGICQIVQLVDTEVAVATILQKFAFPD